MLPTAPVGRHRAGPAHARRGGLEGDPQPGPMRAFFERISARRGQEIAATATRAQAVRAPLADAHPRRGLCLLAALDDPPQDPPGRTGSRSATPEGNAGIAGGKSKQVGDAERGFSRQAEAAYRRLVSDWQATGPPTLCAGAALGRASQRSSKDKAARRPP